MTLKTALRQGIRLLEEASVAVPRLTAEVLLSHALGRERTYLYAHPEEEIGQAARAVFGRCLYERIQGMPTQYITRRQEFYGREFRVTPDVLIPRPETEHVVETARRWLNTGSHLVDAGTGSGAIAVTLNLETGARATATDISAAALRVAAGNAVRLRARVSFLACDIVDALAARRADVLVSNPPYVPLTDRESLQREVRDYEPAEALFAGPTGFEIYQRLIEGARRVLRPGGRVVFELGFKSLDGVRAMLADGWRDIEVVADLAGIPRVIAARLEP